MRLSSPLQGAEVCAHVYDFSWKNVTATMLATEEDDPVIPGRAHGRGERAVGAKAAAGQAREHNPDVFFSSAL